MERCPNCGAPARPGAKFCTTCGYRLPAVAPSDPTAESDGAAATGSASSWPPPPTSAGADSATSSQDQPAESREGSDEVIAMPAPAPDPDADPNATAEVRPEPDADDEVASTDSVLSSSWPSPPAAPPVDPWATSNDFSDDSRSEDDDAAAAGVSEEVVVVPAPASQYEGWSAAVVEEAAPAAESQGTNIARARALLDELRLLLPALNTGAGGGDSDAVAAELEAAISTSPQAAGDRQALRNALNEARDNPRDIQTILALSTQADAAIALLDEHEHLIAAVQQALASLRPQRPGISE